MRISSKLNYYKREALNHKRRIILNFLLYFISVLLFIQSQPLTLLTCIIFHFHTLHKSWLNYVKIECVCCVGPFFDVCICVRSFWYRNIFFKYTNKFIMREKYTLTHTHTPIRIICFILITPQAIL